MNYYKHDQQYEECSQPVNDILLKLDESFVVSCEENEEKSRWKVTVDQEQVKSSSIMCKTYVEVTNVLLCIY